MWENYSTGNTINERKSSSVATDLLHTDLLYTHTQIYIYI